MTQPTTMRGSHLLIMLGDGNSPEQFAAPCGLTTKGIDFAAAVNEFNVPDCDDPDAPMWTDRVVSALSAGVTGSGTLAMESLDDWRDWFLSGAVQNVQVSLDESAAVNGGYFSMSAVLSGFKLSGVVGELTQIEVTIASNGEVIWTDAAS